MALLLHNTQIQRKPNFAYGAMAAICMPCEIADMNIRLRDFRSKQRMTLEAMAERTGFSVSQLSRWESGDSNIPSQRLPELAAAYGCRIGDIFAEDLPIEPLGPMLYVKGEVAAGVWKPAYELPQDEWVAFTGRADVVARLDHRFGLRIVGESMNLVYPHGTVAECVSVFGDVAIAPGRRVVVLRERDDDQFEATVKELVEQDGRLWAAPRSTNPTFQAFPLDENEPGIIETRIIAVVVSSIRPE